MLLFFATGMLTPGTRAFAFDSIFIDVKADTRMRKGDSDTYGDGKAAGVHFFLDKQDSMSFESFIYTPQADANGLGDSKDTSVGIFVYGHDSRVAAERAEGGHPRFGFALGLGLENGFALTTGREVDRWLHGGGSPRFSDPSTGTRPAIQMNVFGGETGIALIGIDLAVSIFAYGGINLGTIFDNIDLAVGLVVGDREGVGRFRPQLRGMSISPFGTGLIFYGLLDARAFAYDSLTQLMGTNPFQAELRAGFHSPTLYGVWLSGEYLHRFIPELRHPLEGHESPVDWLVAGIGAEF